MTGPRVNIWTAILAGWVLFGVTSSVSAAETESVGPDPQQYAEVVQRGINYLVSQGQASDGSFSSQAGVGGTGLAVTALLRNGRSVDDPAVRRGLRFIESNIQEDGGIYTAGSFYRNYETSIALMCLSEANRHGRYDEVIAAAERFVKGLQWDEEEGKTRADYAYGGAGYGSHKRPDLSNTSYLIDALHACGNGADDPAIQKALIFVSRCQNLETEHNATPFAAKNPDGGFYYTIAAGGESKAGETPNGGLRSYASMTYAGLKSLIYAGLDEDDPRVKAATEWIRKFYDLSQNPGLGAQGLYYYYHVFAKTMDALGEPYFVDASGTRHDWRRELTEELARRQLPNGSWVNEADRWFEGDPNLVTAYALLALSYCKPQPVQP